MTHVLHRPERRREGQEKRKEMRQFCCIDTEFNAFDYRGQNDGVQEIVEIGCAVVEDGMIIDTFHRRCRLKTGHVLTKRCMEITGLEPGLLEDEMPYPQVLSELRIFIRQYGLLSQVYALGKEDRNQMLRTAQLYRMARRDVSYLKNIISADKLVGETVGTPSSNISFSLADLCEICGVRNEQEHSALADACALAHCMHHMETGDFSRERAAQIGEKKVYRSLYKQQRRIREASDEQGCDLETLQQLEKVILATGGEAWQKHALIDDLRLLCGYTEKYEEP